MSDIDDHKIITAFDIYKDARLFSKLPINPLENPNLFKNIRYITSIDEQVIANIKQQYEKIKANDFFTNLQKNEVIKTPIKSLGTIDETHLGTVDNCKEAIKKEKPRFLRGLINFFHDAGSYPTEFCENSDICKYYETIASYIDPGPRPSNNTFIYTKDVDIILPDILHQCGIGDKGTEIKYEPTDEEGFYKITITFKRFLHDNTILLEGKINRNGVFKEISVNINGNIISLSTDADREALQKLFRGNNTKNEYINKSDKNEIIATLYYLCKELGDTYQAIILKMIIDHLKNGKSLNGFNLNDDKNTYGQKQNIKNLNDKNCCLSTNDSVLFLRSKSNVINIPVLLYNDGYVRYYSSLSKTEIIRKILTDDIDNAIKENENTINFLGKIDENTRFIIGAKTDPAIRLDLTKRAELFDDDEEDDDEEIDCKGLLEIIKVNIEIVNGFLEGLKQYINEDHPSLSLVSAAAEPSLESPSTTSHPILKRIQEKNIESRRVTYGAICKNIATLLAENNNDSTYMQSIQRNINAFKSLLTIKIGGDSYKIIYKTRSIFQNVSLLEPNNKLRNIMKQCSFIRGNKLIEFRDWLNGNRNDSRGGHSHYGGAIGYSKNDIYEFTYDEDIKETNNFIFLYENLFPYINCFPQLLYCFKNQKTLEKFIKELYSLNFIKPELQLITVDMEQQDITTLVNQYITSEKDKFVIDNYESDSDIIINNFLENVKIIANNMMAVAKAARAKKTPATRTARAKKTLAANMVRMARVARTNAARAAARVARTQAARIETMVAPKIKVVTMAGPTLPPVSRQSTLDTARAPSPQLSLSNKRKHGTLRSPTPKRRLGFGLTRKRRKRNKKIQTLKKNLKKQIKQLKKNFKKQVIKLNLRKDNRTPRKYRFLNTLKPKKRKNKKKDKKDKK